MDVRRGEFLLLSHPYFLVIETSLNKIGDLSMAYEVIIPAAGKGKRMGVGKNKLLLELDHTPIFIHTLKVFDGDEWCEGIVLVIAEEDEQTIKEIIKQYDWKKEIRFAYGGAERQHSVYNGLQAVHNVDIVLVHDGARPFIEVEQIHDLVNETRESGAAVLAVPVKDTIKRVNNETVVETIDRLSLWAIQTPQAFHVSILKEAHNKASKENFLGTDEASLVERMNYSVKIVKGKYSNIKITTPEDLIYAEAIYKKMRA